MGVGSFDLLDQRYQYLLFALAVYHGDVLLNSVCVRIILPHKGNR